MDYPHKNLVSFRSPKRKSASKNTHNWYSYYAGYSAEFVEDVLNYLQLPLGASILDPWNGSGTTTHIVEKEGYNAIGFDINPVMPIIANSRRVDNFENIEIHAEKITKQAKRYRSKFIPSGDPLLVWLCDKNVITIRKIERAIQQSLLQQSQYSYAKSADLLKKVLAQPLLAFFYVALFQTVKELLRTFKTSNPTWIKQPEDDNQKVRVDDVRIFEYFGKYVDLMIESSKAFENTHTKSSVLLDIASSQNIPLSESCIDAVITSPPYCTRIDYVIATRLELAVLGIGNGKEFEELRTRMIGTTKITREVSGNTVIWGNTANEFLNRVKNHPSKASQSYYLKHYIQYFHNMFLSLVEINRVLKKKGRVIIVIQDSYYKDVHLDLAQVIVEMGETLGWKLIHQESYYQSQTLAGINKSKLKYRKNSSATEEALIFRKED
ncbi:DNA methyltransferase [Paenibacillus sp. FSL M7-1455]|uniref:site-specific DNA-methyltransferase (cytosine-N(4)-specific) n=1 Tax=Paenibacillus cookii TaxID=157839 RepID=A0ABQ4M3K0_9BACL|nr:DNA methyltransferase [Paenibacillus cookii]GIO70067.1 hypothetical protein J21TS3_48880 [Paenibacillus cookii]